VLSCSFEELMDLAGKVSSYLLVSYQLTLNKTILFLNFRHSIAI